MRLGAMAALVIKKQRAYIMCLESVYMALGSGFLVLGDFIFNQYAFSCK